MRKALLILVLALVGAACGSVASEPFQAPSTSTAPSAGAEAPTPPPTAGSDPAADQPAEAAETQIAPVTPPATLPDSDYPDVVVVDLLGGGEVNLRELALETEPVLLWFWAPH